MKKYNLFYVIWIVLISFNLSFGQEINFFIRDNSRMNKMILKLTEKTNKLTVIEKFKVNEKFSLEDELKFISKEIEEEEEKFSLFGDFTEEIV